MKITINGKEFDLQKAVPLKVRDFKKLEARGVNVQKLELRDLTATSEMVLVLLQKCDPSATMEDVDELDLVLMEQISTFIAREARVVNRPT